MGSPYRGRKRSATIALIPNIRDTLRSAAYSETGHVPGPGDRISNETRLRLGIRLPHERVVVLVGVAHEAARALFPHVSSLRVCGSLSPISGQVVLANTDREQKRNASVNRFGPKKSARPLRRRISPPLDRAHNQLCRLGRSGIERDACLRHWGFRFPTET